MLKWRRFRSTLTFARKLVLALASVHCPFCLNCLNFYFRAYQKCESRVEVFKSGPAIFLAISPLQERVSVAGNVAGAGGGVFGIMFRCVSRCRLKLAASFLSSLISPGMVLKRAGPEEQNELIV